MKSTLFASVLCTAALFLGTAQAKDKDLASFPVPITITTPTGTANGTFVIQKFANINNQLNAVGTLTVNNFTTGNGRCRRRYLVSHLALGARASEPESARLAGYIEPGGARYSGDSRTRKPAWEFTLQYSGTPQPRFRAGQTHRGPQRSARIVIEPQIRGGEAFAKTPRLIFNRYGSPHPHAEPSVISSALTCSKHCSPIVSSGARRPR
jgi:hypothetical protein